MITIPVGIPQTEKIMNDIDDIHLIALKYPLFPGFRDQTTCEVYQGHIWAAGTCISVNNEPKNFYEAFYTCKQRNVLLTRVKSPELNAAILSHLNSDVSYHFLLTGQNIFFSKCKMLMLCISCQKMKVIQWRDIQHVSVSMSLNFVTKGNNIVCDF